MKATPVLCLHCKCVFALLMFELAEHKGRRHGKSTAFTWNHNKSAAEMGFGPKGKLLWCMSDD